ncbi:Type 1 glutamine amidotransferase-like domain-containing protein [Salipiger mucosus]|uniref:Type 1 glutamine amidotransferase-like domain-containing protein n=1 Tax=Salipiger mucosus TaxID=263378 RepID=UPI0003769DF9|nr:Type 1 glutamine amidotransferase-like domain-containing protein [Salipiger mucosus]
MVGVKNQEQTAVAQDVPRGLSLHLLSSIDSVSNSVGRLCQGMEGARALVIDTAVRGMGRTVPPDKPLPMSRFDLNVDLCDIRACARQELSDRLAAADVCAILGGNTYVLNHAAAQVDFGDLLAQRAEQGPEPFHVFGSSAGALIFGRDISHAGTLDNPSAAPDIVETGVGWIDARILPHRRCPYFGIGPRIEKLIRTDPDLGSFLVIDEWELMTFDGPELVPSNVPR